MSREQLGDDLEPVASSRPEPRVAEAATAGAAAVGAAAVDLGPRTPPATTAPAGADTGPSDGPPAGNARADLEVEELDAPAQQLTPDRKGPRRPPQPLIAIVVAAVFAVCGGAIVAYQQTRSTITRNAAAGGRILFWSDRAPDTLSPRPYGARTWIVLHLVSGAGVPLTVERVDIADIKLTPARPVQVPADGDVQARFSFLADCTWPAAAADASAIARDQQGRSLRLPAAGVGGVVELIHGSACGSRSPVAVSEMAAHPDGSVSLVLTGRTDAPATRVRFILENRAADSPWRLTADPGSTVDVRTGATVAVTLRLSYRDCVGERMPPTSGVLTPLLTSRYGSDDGYLDGWDDGAVSAAAAAAILGSCR